MANCRQLVKLLRGPGTAFVQTHDFPDHDSVASAFALQQLLRTQGVDAAIVYEGEVQRDSLAAMTDALGIALHHSATRRIQADDLAVVVDGCAGNHNVSRLPARRIGVIDHHIIEHPDDVPYVDIRPGYGACSTIVYDYYRELGLPVSPAVATALLVGINVDTRHLVRGASARDVAAYTALYRKADARLTASILGQSLEQRDLAYYRAALNSVVVHDRFAFCHLAEGCSRNLLGVLSDFFSGLREVDVVVLCASEAGRLNLSVRCEREIRNASALVQQALAGIGMGGGHRHMAGGSVLEGVAVDAEEIYRRFCALLGAVPRTLAAPVEQANHAPALA